VVRPDRALVIFAADHVEECMDAGTPDCMVRLVFDLLRTDTIPPQAALSYASVMALARQLPAPTVSTLAVDSAPERLARFIRKVGALVPANERAHEGRDPSADAASAAR
jgi:hypothetical protein